ncbi:MAG: TRAP transporter small permease [Deltaproteobacteria bacterium]|nr:TRAP transporter small permease [Deltaproteobacteria bacterium]
MSSFEKTVHLIARCLNWIAGVSLVVIMIIVCINVFNRAVFAVPLKGSVDLLSQMGVLVIACAIGYTQMVKGHIRITFLTDRIPGKAGLLVAAIVDLIGLILFAIITWQSVLYTISAYKIGELSEVLRLPVMPFAAIVSAGCLVLTLVLLTDLIRLLTGGEK